MFREFLSGGSYLQLNSGIFNVYSLYLYLLECYDKSFSSTPSEDHAKAIKAKSVSRLHMAAGRMYILLFLRPAAEMSGRLHTSHQPIFHIWEIWQSQNGYGMVRVKSSTSWDPQALLTLTAPFNFHVCSLTCRDSASQMTALGKVHWGRLSSVRGSFQGSCTSPAAGFWHRPSHPSCLIHGFPDAWTWRESNKSLRKITEQCQCEKDNVIR